MIQFFKAETIRHIITKEPGLLAKMVPETPSLAKVNPNIQLMQNLLHSLSKEEVTSASVRESLKTASMIKNSPILANELRPLVNLLEKNPLLKHLAPPLKNFLSTPNESNRQNLENRLTNSGIFYESNLKNQMLPLKIEIAIKNLENHLAKAPLAENFKREIQAQIDNLLKQERPSLKSLEGLLVTLDRSLSHAKKYLSDKHPLLLISKTLNTIEKNMLSLKSSVPLDLKIDKSSSIQSLAKDLLVKLVNNESIFKILSAKEQKTLIEIKNTLSKISQTMEQKPTKLNYITEKVPLHQKHILAPKASLNPKVSTTNETNFIAQTNTKNPPLSQALEYKASLVLNLTENFDRNSENVSFAWINRLIPNEPSSASKDLQTKLLEAILKLKNIIKIQDSTALKLPSAIERIDTLSAQIKASLPQVDLKTNLPKDESLNDIKRILLSVEKSTKGSESSVAREAHAVASRALSQIDFHQLYSYVNQHTHAYLPYLWDGLQSGAMQFKKEDEQMYCKIDLEFTKYKKVEILIALFDKQYISLTVAIEHPELFLRIKNNLKTLRELLSSANLVPHTITLLPTLKEMPYESFEKEDAFGFDFKA